ncbi:Eco57I restriction-modification methylase [Cyclonatronum proteinivorum]|uniref:Eco57I restriction-modification methylase n=2 Tax=Cyclonatronum proteinivorum TaxID=1457365 RepID=A0A345UPT9_9BACT|nr:Eco57I restriction-modification methylase [Cyclonatronum proteinivorum]
MVPGVKEAKALSRLLKAHPVFGQFEIVNVAGDGDEEEKKEDALQKVEQAISDKPHETYTITLSCGRLTTGVSVKAWTAVFMLSGSYNTSASAYMQTIFRVQTPATINGKMKEECFVFDFAPDRTLKVVAEAAKISSKAGTTSDQDRKIIGDFLNFCPIISVQGTQMRSYNVENMLEQLKKVYIEKVVRNGFEDEYLYNTHELMKLDEVELEDFIKLKKIIGSTKAMPKSGDIDLNKQGFDKEEYEQLERAKKKKQRELTEEEKALLEAAKEKKKNRDTAISILRGISIRMPLLLYGAEVSNEDRELTIENFTELVDDQSWKEFMPKDVTKKVFLKFKKYYDPDVFRAAGKRIRAMARAADSLKPEDRIERITALFATFRNPDKETVLTPWRVVNMHLGDCLGGYVFLDESREKTLVEPRFVSQGEVTREVFSPEGYILEINSKSGLYPLYMAYSIFRNELEKRHPGQDVRTLELDQLLSAWDKVVKENIFVICKTPMAKAITKRTLVGFRQAEVNTRYFEDLVHQITDKPEQFMKKVQNGKTYWKANTETTMTFNAIVGNPPYQVSAESGNRSIPVYNHFIDISKKFDPKNLSLIVPSRWMSGGLGLSDFRQSMLEDRRISNITDYPDSGQIFPGVEVKGGICYFLWDNDFDGKCSVTTIRGENVYGPIKRELNKYDILVRDSISVTILDKILAQEEESIINILSVDKEFGWTSNFKDFQTKKIDGHIPLYYIVKGKRKLGWISREEVTKSVELIDTCKVMIPAAGSDGGKRIPDIVLGKPLIASKPSVCTQSYLFFYVDDMEKATNIEKYLKTKFLRFLVSLRKMTQHATRSTYTWVPLQNFTTESDINWDAPIPKIDQQLYQKYGLNPEEIAFIEGMIKRME